MLFGGWLGDLAQSAENKQIPQDGIDLNSIAEKAVNGDPTVAILMSMGKAFWEWLSRKKDKRRVYSVPRRFFILGAFWETVQVTYQVDHDEKQIIVRLFQGLPGQGD